MSLKEISDMTGIKKDTIVRKSGEGVFFRGKNIDCELPNSGHSYFNIKDLRHIVESCGFTVFGLKDFGETLSCQKCHKPCDKYIGQTTVCRTCYCDYAFELFNVPKALDAKGKELVAKLQTIRETPDFDQDEYDRVMEELTQLVHTPIDQLSEFAAEIREFALDEFRKSREFEELCAAEVKRASATAIESLKRDIVGQLCGKKQKKN